jgi:hypothetical protein
MSDGKFDRVLDDAVPAHDLADQQRPARPDPAEEAQEVEQPEDVLEADPADVADQRRVAPVLDETEPWP